MTGGETGPVARPTDPNGRDVVFDDSSRRHLAAGRRAWLLQHVDLILATVSLPDYK